MSENLHDIDDLFKKAIEAHDDTPSQKVWEAIDKNLDKNRVVSISRKYNKLKWVAAILLLASFGMAMYTWQTRMQNRELVKQHGKQRQRTNGQPLKSAPQRPSVEEDRAENNSKSSREPVKESRDNTVLQQSTSKTPTVQAHTNRFTSVRTFNKTKVDGSLPEKNLVLQQSDKPYETKITEPEFNSPRYIVRLPGIFNTPEWRSPVPSTHPFVYNSLAAKPISISDDVDVNRNKTSKFKNNPSAKPSPFSIALFVSPEFISSSVTNDHPRYREDDRHEIRKNEKVRTALSYGFRLDYKLPGNWSIGTGLSVFTKTTDINAKMAYARPDNGGHVNYRISCSAGSAFVPLKSGNSPVQGDSAQIRSASNKLQYITIPLSVKYTIGKGRMSLSPSVGITANFLSAAKVRTEISSGGANEKTSTNSIEGLKANFFSTQLSTEAAYRLSKNISVSFSPVARLGLSSINRDAAVRTKLNSFGLSAGLHIKL